mmetsp:Transcript_53163/g.122138  ORF Transcript_53163/g.122138 Transcript_53163/m.122138 type:complete len:86 (-) Transcript_53163:319-576(-)
MGVMKEEEFLWLCKSSDNWLIDANVWFLLHDGRGLLVNELCRCGIGWAGPAVCRLCAISSLTKRANSCETAEAFTPLTQMPSHAS